MPIYPEPEIRQLRAADMSSLLALSGAAGWNQTVADWMVLLEVQPDGCLGIEVGGQVVATATLIQYGRRLAWLGMVLTLPDHRRRGFARRLVSSCLQIAADRGIETVKLDATENGMPLYESFGFVGEQTIERWSGHGKAEGMKAQRADGEKPDCALDRTAIGADRWALLHKLARNGYCRSSENGFAMMRPGANADYLGPCVARAQEAARLLIEDCLRTSRSQVYWDLMPENLAALELAREFGFRRTRRLVRMRWGVDLRGAESMIYAAGGFELG